MTEPTPGVAALVAARTDVLARIAAACQRAGRSPAEVTLVAVSKTVDAARLRDAVAAGLSLLGENRVQEGVAKAPEVPGARWQLIGPLQSNKARRAVEVYEAIQSVESVGLAERLDRLAREVRGAGPSARYPVLLQVNVDDDPAKAGFQPGALPEALERIRAFDALEIRGLMTIGRLVEGADAARPTFVGLRELAARVRSGGATLGPDLSMGMSDDFEVAVEEGATIVRVGRALFGERPHHHGDGTLEHTH
jgi:pyridoxal phosphate enzyme (YggS family)